MYRTTQFISLSLAAFVMTALVGCGMSSRKIQDGSYVTIDYSLEADGQTLVPLNNPETMELVVGQSVYPPAYEKQLLGLTVGSKKVITLAPEQAFGPIRPDLFVRVPKSQLPPNIQEGMIMGGTARDGSKVNMRVTKILPDTVILDQNHPLAGKSLTYHIKVVEIT